jgi:hypothetical protein
MSAKYRASLHSFFCGEVHRVCTRRAFTQAVEMVVNLGTEVKFVGAKTRSLSVGGVAFEAVDAPSESAGSGAADTFSSIFSPGARVAIGGVIRSASGKLSSKDKLPQFQNCNQP